MSSQACTQCDTAFGVTVWRHTCFRCGNLFCSSHLTELPRPEAARRFGPERQLLEEADGICVACDRYRVTTVKDGLRESVVEGDHISLDNSLHDDRLLATSEFRVSAVLKGKTHSFAVLVPFSPWDSSLWLLRLVDGRGVELVGQDKLSEVWADILAAPLQIHVERSGLSESDLARMAATMAEQALKWRRDRWLKSDIDHRIAWIQGVTARGTPDLGAAAMAQATAELARGLLEPTEANGTNSALAVAGGVAALGVARAIGVNMLRTAVPWIGAVTLVAAGVAWFLEEDPPIQKLSRKAAHLAKAPTAAEARAGLAAAAHELARGSVASGPLTGQARVHRALANFLIWLAEGQRGALLDAANDAEPMPLAVSIAAGIHRDTEPLQRFLAGRRGLVSEFPWDHLVQRLADLQTGQSHWTRQPLGTLRLGERLSSGAAKEVWSLLDRQEVVVAVQLQGQAPAVRREVDLLLALAKHVGQAGSLLGLVQIEKAGYVERNGRRRMAYIMPRLQLRPPTALWPSAAMSVSSALAVVQTLAHLHHLGYVHGDIKPGNVLWDANNRAVLVDYGGAIKLTTDGTAHAYVSSAGFDAPEVAGEGRVQTASDVYSLCRTLDAWLAEAADAPSRQDGARHHRELLDAVEEGQRKDPKVRPSLDRLTKVLQQWLVMVEQPKSRMAELEQVVERQLQLALARWRERPAAPVMDALRRALRGQHLPPAREGSDGHLRAIASDWIAVAAELTCSELWQPWASQVGQSSMRSEVIDCLTRSIPQHRDLELLAKRIDGQMVEFRPLLGQTAYLLRDADYHRVQWSVLAWRQRVDNSASLTKLVKLAQRLANLRNRLVHGSEGECGYGSVRGGELVLRSEDMQAITDDVLELGAELLGRRA